MVGFLARFEVGTSWIWRVVASTNLYSHVSGGRYSI